MYECVYGCVLWISIGNIMMLTPGVKDRITGNITLEEPYYTGISYSKREYGTGKGLSSVHPGLL